MPKLCLILAASVPLFAYPIRGGTQQPFHDRPSLATTLGFSSLPDGLSTQCGNRGGPSGAGGGLEFGAALMLRVRRWLVLQGDTRATDDMLEGLGCLQVGAGVDTAYARNLQHHVLATSTLRAGVETPPGWLLVRLTAGGGLVWGSRMVPLGVLAVGTGTRGRGKRFLIEFERLQTRLHATEVHDNGEPAQPGAQIPIVVHQEWYALRLGVEFPLHSERAEHR